MPLPQTAESAWRAYADPLPAWLPSDIPALVVAPHPDDETLAAAGLILHLRARGIPVTVAAVTDGEAAYPDMPGLPALREREQAEALACLGVQGASIHRLHLPDSGVGAEEARLLALLLRLIPEGGQIIAPWPHDFHPDHEACGRAAAKAARQTGAALTFWLFWTWHHGDPALLSPENAVQLPLTPGQRSQKQAALAKHHSQLQHPNGGDPILPPELLAPAQRPYEVFLLA